MTDTGLVWQLPSTTGQCIAVWEVEQRFDHSPAPCLVCTFSFKVRSVSSDMPRADLETRPDMLLRIGGLRIARRDLERFEHELRQWHTLPLARLAETPLQTSGLRGSKFDEDLQLSLGDEPGRPVARITYGVTLLSGMVEFVTDPSCIEILAD